MTILLELKEYWGNNSSDIFQMWNLNYSPCSNWPGITCSSDGFVTVLYKCSRLEILDLSGNQFYGPLPTDIHRMSRLTFLDLIANRFDGTIPKSIAWLTKLKHLSLSKNMFEGTIPPEIGNLSNLEKLGMAYMKKFEFASIPYELGKLKNLKVLLIIQSNLIGNIPESFSSLSSLKTLDLSSNYLNGSIPGWLFHLKSLTKVDLSWNRLSGNIPSQLDEDIDYDLYGNFNLCTSNTSYASKYLPSCSCNHKQTRTIILALVGTILVVVIFILLCWRKRQVIGDRKFIPLRRTELTESEIPLNLTDENFIGRGRCGDVYRIAVHQNGSHVAVKRIRKERELDSRLEKQFLAELQILSEIQHPNIVKLICCISNMDSNFLVYEYMENQSLDKWKRQVIGDRKFIPLRRTELTESEILLNLTDENFIGRGRCGDVYRIAVHQNGSHVAVKRIRKERELDSRLEKQFLAELQILSEIQHPNIVKLICCISNMDSNFLV
ncbi:LRR receptor-like serine/threonine-protein kinase RGI5 [Lycium ferocissimum]|uniref:LRR receptor-like serine/threonine-protein kinase RGI5 n=1 Tax=Lycium ferocissimum TaxID=112874 RepID=UPI0028154F49|nr:LRR receptor-like serine/threonine-protein kinase RGI5 [Lycium ferocissimum]